VLLDRPAPFFDIGTLSLRLIGPVLANYTVRLVDLSEAVHGQLRTLLVCPLDYDFREVYKSHGEQKNG